MDLNNEQGNFRHKERVANGKLNCRIDSLGVYGISITGGF